MHVAQREFTEEILERIGQTVRDTADLTRGALSRLVCGWLNWKDAAGRAKESSCRALLVKLERRGLIELPPARPVSFLPGERAHARPQGPWPELKTTLHRLGEVELVVVNGNRAHSRVWRAMMKAHHPLGDGPLCGAQLRYLIRTEQGWLGGLSFSSAAWRLGVREAWIGWSEATRAARLPLIALNSRFLILPSVQVPHLASHVLGLATRQLAGDWQQRYGHKPVLVETFVDSSRYRGTCYRAANWIELGLTEGRGRQDRARLEQLAPKHVFVYPLHRNWRKILTAPLELPRLLPTTPVRAPIDWAQEEFGRCRLSAPLTERLMTMARDFWSRPMADIPEACQSQSKMQAAYRFLSNEDVEFETLLQPHYAATEQRIRDLDEGSVVLVPQDTTTVNYTGLNDVEGLGPIGTTVDGAQGLHLHSSLAMTVQGVPLGFLDAQCWARDPKEFGKKVKRASLPIEDKESYRWIKSYQALAAVQKRNPRVQLVSVGDREADIYELFEEALRDPAAPKVLVRAMHDRKVLGEEQRLFETVQAEPVAGYQSIHLPRTKSRAARQAELEIRFATITVCPPKSKPGLAPLAVQMVLAQEVGPVGSVGLPAEVEPIEWALLTTIKVESFEQACEKLAWYTQRWGIEVFHRTLKSGCRVEDRQLGHGDRLQACLAIDMVIAWRILHMTKLGREVPDLPAQAYFAGDECEVLIAHDRRNRSRPKDAPPLSLYEAIRAIAKLGGFIGRNSDGEPGTETLWRGLLRLDGMTEGWRLANDP